MKKRSEKKMAGKSLALPCTMSLLILPTTLALAEDPTIFQVTDYLNLLNRKFLKHNNNINSLLLPARNTEENFKLFVKKYNKEYATREEYMQRLGVFTKNVVRAIEHQALDPTADHGVTPFIDLTEEEFERMYSGVNVGDGIILEEGAAKEAVTSFVEDGELPDSFDWREKGAVTYVKMQEF